MHLNGPGQLQEDTVVSVCAQRCVWCVPRATSSRQTRDAASKLAQTGEQINLPGQTLYAPAGLLKPSPQGVRARPPVPKAVQLLYCHAIARTSIRHGWCRGPSARDSPSLD